MFCAAQLDAGAAVTVVVEASEDELGDCAEAGAADIEAARTATARNMETMVWGGGEERGLGVISKSW